MPGSKQQPLTAPYGRDELDLSQPYPEWEAAVFDNAAYYAAVDLQAQQRRMVGPRDFTYTRFTVFPWAVRYARKRPGVLLYAVSSQGRFNCLDKEKWAEWSMRWRIVNNKPMLLSDEADAA